MTDILDESQIDNQFIKKKTITGTTFSVLSSGLRMVVNFVGNILLARVLAPAVFGAFGVITFVVQQVPVLFYDLGLQQSLVQKKEPPSKEELKTIFTVNFLTACFFVVLIFLLAPFLAGFYQVNTRGAWLFRAFSLVIFSFLLEGIPLALVKRRLGFGQLIWVSLAGAVSFNLIAVILAFLDFGILSLIFGTLVSRFVSVFLVYWFQPWLPGFGFKEKKLRQFLQFGLPLKGTTIIGLASLSIVPLLVGAVLGLEAVGYYNFSSRILSLVLVIPGIVQPIVFSSLARSQTDAGFFGRLLEKTVEWVVFLVFPLVALLIALAPQFISFIYTDKWLPALEVFSLLLVAGAVSCPGGIFTQGLLSLGKARIVFKISFLRALIEWGLSLGLIYTLGFQGVAWAKLIAAFTGFLPIFFLKKELKIKTSTLLLPYFLASLFAGLVVKLLVPLFLRGITTMVLLFIGGFLVYFLLLLPFKGKSLWRDALKIKKFLLKV